ncbi:MAG TPA: glycosyltransferase [Xanthobacteraceae bacterium]|nr:glycosyltransferase [Xanthobacteraceae bacterium]
MTSRSVASTSVDPSESGAGAAAKPLTVLIAVPTLHAGAADVGALELVQILAAAGHKAIVVSGGGRLLETARASGATCITLNAGSRNPLTMLRNALAMTRLARAHRCDLIHAHGRAPAWSAYLAARATGTPFLTTWYKGFREQNALKHLYNGIMARGDRVIVVSDQLADLVHQRYGTPWDRIAVVPLSVDSDRFDPATVSPERRAAVRHAWGVGDAERIVLVLGRMRRRKGHHVVVDAACRLKAMGLKDFVVVFASEDQGTRYAAELWDQVLASGANDVIRIAGGIDDLPAAYAAAATVVSAAIQPEGLQRALLEAQAMGRPVIASDLGAGPEVILAAPTVTRDRITGLRCPAGDAEALAHAVARLFSMPPTEQQAMGVHGRAWIRSRFDAQSGAAATLKLYAETAARQKVA